MENVIFCFREILGKSVKINDISSTQFQALDTFKIIKKYEIMAIKLWK